MYLGAMPTIASQWHVTTGQVSLTLVLWFVAFSGALLAFGPLSDKYGRKPILVGGLILFMLASIGCAASVNLSQLILFRILQGIGAAGPSAMVMAIARDRYEGSTRKKVLAYMGTIMAFAPMIAPSIGAFLLLFTSWPSIFLFQAIFALVCLFFVTRFGESNLSLISGNLFALLGRYRVVMSNRRYMLANTTMGLLSGPLFAFIALSSPIYIKVFHMSEQAFGLFFGFNALMFMIGALSCTRLTKWFSDNVILTGCMVGSILSGVLILSVGSMHPIALALSFGVFSICCGITRPLSTHLILDQVQTDVGSASSFLTFYVFVIGATSMAVVSIPWEHPIMVLGWFAVVAPTIVLILWPLLLKQLAIDNDRTDDMTTGEAELVPVDSD
jgi:DHA1 family bicyclomycin/chloramphenicol resistance-like MFS transporter